MPPSNYGQYQQPIQRYYPTTNNFTSNRYTSNRYTSNRNYSFTDNRRLYNQRQALSQRLSNYQNFNPSFNNGGRSSFFSPHYFADKTAQTTIKAHTIGDVIKTGLMVILGLKLFNRVFPKPAKQTKSSVDNAKLTDVNIETESDQLKTLKSEMRKNIKSYDHQYTKLKNQVNGSSLDGKDKRTLRKELKQDIKKDMKALEKEYELVKTELEKARKKEDYDRLAKRIEDLNNKVDASLEKIKTDKSRVLDPTGIDGGDGD